MTTGIELYVQATISVLVIVDPFIRGIFFRTLTEHEPERRAEYVRKLMIVVGITLGVSALAGRELLELLGINLGAFGVAGGFVLTLMGFEMLLGGEPSRTQGGEEAREAQTPESAEDQILVPYAIPFLCGPGAITTVITLSSSTSDGSGAIAALVAVAITVALLPVGHLWLVNKITLSEKTMGIITRFGGLFIATIGVQLMLGGIQTFFGLS